MYHKGSDLLFLLRAIQVPTSFLSSWFHSVQKEDPRITKKSLLILIFTRQSSIKSSTYYYLHRIRIFFCLITLSELYYFIKFQVSIIRNVLLFSFFGTHYYLNFIYTNKRNSIRVDVRLTFDFLSSLYTLYQPTPLHDIGSGLYKPWSSQTLNPKKRI